MISKSNGLDLNIPYIKRGFSTKYNIVKPLDCGRFGTVYLAECRDTSAFNKYVAVKQLPAYRHDVKQYNNVQMLMNEITNMRKLRGAPNVVKLIDVYDDDNTFSLVQEYCESEPIKRLLKSKPDVDDNEVTKLIGHLVHGIYQCHNSSICHSDIKPSNILYHPTEKVYKLIDFGSSFKAEQHTGSTSIKGTPWFFAKEKFVGDYGMSSDLWAVGVLTYLLLFNAHPFLDEVDSYLSDKKLMPHDIYNAIVSKPILWHETRKTNISDNARDFIANMLVKDHKKRMNAEEAMWHPYIKHVTASLLSSANI